MENNDKDQKDHTEKEQASAYQELYGKKEGEDQEGNKEGTEPLDNAGAFGSAASKVWSENGDRHRESEHSEDSSDEDAQGN